MSNSKMIPIKCTQCGAVLQVDKDQGKMVCEYCGCTFMIEQAINNYEVHNHINVEAGKTNYQSTLDFISDQLEKKRAFQRENQKQAAQNAASKRVRNIILAAICLLLVVAVIIGSNYLPSHNEPSAVTEAQNNDQEGVDTSQKDEVHSETEADQSDQNMDGETTAEEKSSDDTSIIPDEGIAHEGTPRNGFDEDTNKELSFYGYLVSIPNYYSSEDESGDTKYYFAETGKAVAMLMVHGTEIENFSEYENRDDEEILDEFVSGSLHGFSDYNPVILTKTNMIIADSPCCLVEVEGDFLKPSATGALFMLLNKEKHNIVSLMLLQSTNTRFDYSEDFNKIVLSIVKDE